MRPMTHTREPRTYTGRFWKQRVVMSSAEVYVVSLQYYHYGIPREAMEGTKYIAGTGGRSVASVIP